MEYITLNNGVKMPKLGYGVFRVTKEEGVRCVLDAIEAGYRSIDTAQAYGNEEEVGIALKKSGVPREELFITTKIWVTNGGYEKAKASIEESLRKMQLSYIDLILIHQPFNDYYGTYRAMVEAYKAGKVRAIGVSNFYADRLIDFCKFAEVVPALNQLETNIFSQQKECREYMDKYGVVHEAWAPLAKASKEFLEHPVLTKIAKNHGKTVAQVALRFLLQKDIVVIPKTTHKERMIENIDVFDFNLTEEEMKELEALDTGYVQLSDHRDPKKVTSLIKAD